MEDKTSQDNTKETSTSSSTVFTDHVVQCQGEAEIVEGISSVDQSVVLKSGGLSCKNESDSQGKLLNSGNSDEEFGEIMELGNDPNTGVGEFLQNDQYPDDKNVFESEENQKKQDVGVEGGPLEASDSARTVGKSIAEASQEQAMSSSGMLGMKRKAETSETNNEAASLNPRADDLQRKWYCSLCDVSTTSEGTLNHHMQGKKHKAKEAKSKSNGTTSITSMDCDSSDNSLQPVGPSNNRSIDGEQTMDAKKWHCSICQVATNSEELLKSHLQGKKHKAKEARLGLDQKTGNLNGIENVKSETITKWYCSLCQVSAASEKNLLDHLQGKKHKIKEGGINPPENEQETTSNTIPEIGEKCTNEQEMKEANLENNSGIDQNQEIRMEVRKYWHCKMCNVGTHDEALMDAHRKSDKHREALRENCGGVIVVSRIMVNKGVEGGKVAKE